MTATREPRQGPAGSWYAAGDINAFFGLAVDNLTNLVVLAGLLAALLVLLAPWTGAGSDAAGPESGVPA